ncbi:acyl-CoA dehydrogenase [uncultured Zhongshania sp.]|uniref:acyl-CoA dehydrogenase n=1 Tax=uncultured Zhongshania sp. TaxID=1642288 RepID=UPI0030DC8396|tara:strand:- start:657 stop:3086 length:2430 start_codon:yes stop_codon:yes gene_type:complete
MIGLLAFLAIVIVTALIFSFQLSRRRGCAVFVGAWLLAGLCSDFFVHPIVLLVLLAVLAVIVVDSLRIRFISAPAKVALKKMMPAMSSTEREALDAGTTWWEKDLFSGHPDWSKFEAIELSTLSEAEQAFLDNETAELCEMLDEWQIHHHDKDLSPAVWQFIKDKGFLGLIIPSAYGGLEFTPYAQSRVVSKIASRSTVAAVSVMVPNSLGPGELLLKYGTDEQKDFWLARLAKGEEVPCFGLTSPEAGSDAGAIPDTGEVCEQEYNGEKVLGVKLNFSKRWITLAPIATVVGLAFRLSDPDGLIGDEVERGITCALVPADLAGVEIGRRHYPGSAFMNGPITGVDVFIPMSMLIGGKKYIGQGWMMLVECLGAGRGISLPALSTAGGEMSYLMVGAFARIRRQFGISVGKFEGVQEASADIAAGAYMLEAYRALVTRALADGAPSVLTAMAKYHATETMRSLINHSMDILGGRAIQMGPRNFMALVYQTIPIAITVEGANILTRSMIIFGQGAMRCHPYLADELEALSDDSDGALERFDGLLSAHLAHTAGVFSRGFLQGLTASKFSKTDCGNSALSARWYPRIDRYSAVFAATADFALLLLGGDLKRRELLSARLGDVHSQLVIACAILKFHDSQHASEANTLHAEFALKRSFTALNKALMGFYQNMPQRWMGCVLRVVFFPWGVPSFDVSDNDIRDLGDMIMTQNPVRSILADAVHMSDNDEDAQGRIHRAFQLLSEIENDYDAVLHGKLPGDSFAEKLQSAVAAGLITEQQSQRLAEYDERRYDCLLTDAFDAKLNDIDVRPVRP